MDASSEAHHFPMKHHVISSTLCGFAARGACLFLAAAPLQAAEKKAATGGARSPSVPQILVEAKFVELTREAEAKLELPLFKTDGAAHEAVRGAMVLSGVLADAQFQAVVKALNQQQGVDILSTPKVVSPSGQRAQIEIAREVSYPTDYEKTGKGWKAKKFATRKTGVTFDVVGTAGKGGTIALELTPRVVEFLGFIDMDNGRKYPASAKTDASLGDRIDSLADVPDGRRAQPKFSEREIHTTVTVFDGQTVVLGTVGDVRGDKSLPQNAPSRRLAIFVTASVVKVRPAAGAGR